MPTFKENGMIPESRIKLMRMLEEIKQYQETNIDLQKNSFLGIGFYVLYPIILYFFMDKPIKEIFFFLTMLIPVSVIYFWLRFRNKLEERYKLLANTVLELGSIAQDEVIKENALIKKASLQKKKIVKKKK